MATFGNTVAGASFRNWSETWGALLHVDASLHYTPSVDETLTELWAYASRSSTGTRTTEIGVYDVDAGTATGQPVFVGSTNMDITPLDGSPAWVSVTGLSISLTAGVTYAIASTSSAENGGVKFYYDTLPSASAEVFGGTNGVLPKPTTTGINSRDDKFSFYAVTSSTGPSLLSPDSVTEGTQTTVTGTELQSLTTFSLQTSDGGSSIVQDTWRVVPEIPWEANFTKFSKDSSDLSILTPSADSRIVFVDNVLGSDGTAVNYGGTIPDPKNYVPANPYLTIAAAMSQMRDGYPDWILLRSGGTWAITSTINPITGRNDLERFVFSSYGSGDRPEITSGTLAAWQGSADSFISLQGIRFYADGRDPSSNSFVGFEVPEITGAGIGVYFYSGDSPAPKIESILVEDCDISYYRNNLSFQGTAGCTNSIVRNNKIVGAYTEVGHSQGLGANLASLIVENNTFDHNGWNTQSILSNNDEAQGQATVFNHNMYISDSVQVIVRNNIIARASSIGLKMTSNPVGPANSIVAQDIRVVDNFVYGGEIGFGIGGNTDFGDGPRWQNVAVNYNVLYAVGHERPTNRALAWYISTNDQVNSECKGNLCRHVVTAGVTDNQWLQAYGYMQDSGISGNRVYGFGGSIEGVTNITNTNFTSVTIVDNIEILTPSLPTIEDWLTLNGYASWDDFINTATSVGSTAIVNYFKTNYGMNA